MSLNRGNKFWCFYQAKNEINYPKNSIGWSDTIYKRLYSVIKRTQDSPQQNDVEHISKKRKLSTRENGNNEHHGGIFNLSFTPDGSLLLAATENKAILLYDPITHQHIRTVSKAHDASINYIKFLDDRIFATCSDDCTVALWDLRNLQQRLRVLRGHSYWVKNVEYEPHARSLLSSSIDGCIYLWDINRYESSSINCGPSDGVHFRKPLYLSCLMRMRLSHDCTKMIIGTSEGYIMVIHDLKLDDLDEDLYGFQSDLYRLMQKGHSCNLDFGSWFNPLFKAKRNRIELISDFPANNESNSIFSLDVHPNDWSIVSRNISRDEGSEWTCVHDIQDDKKPTEKFPLEVPKEGILVTHASHPNPRVTVMSAGSHSSFSPNMDHDEQNDGSFPSSSSNLFDSSTSSTRLKEDTSPSPSTSTTSHTSSTSSSSSSSSPSSSASLSTSSSSSPSPSSYSEASSPSENNNIHNSPVVIISARTLNRRAHATILAPNASYRRIQPGVRNPPRIYKNLDRLTHFCEEPNVGTGYIKELCFSPDGRIVCSPYEYGVRFLSFNSDCSELSSAAHDDPRPLYELKKCSYHSNLVVTTKFSPSHFMLASGCLGGEVIFYQPVL